MAMLDLYCDSFPIATLPWISTKASIGASRNCASSTPTTMTFCRSTSSTPAAGWSCPCCGRRRRRAILAGQAGGRPSSRAVPPGPDPSARRQPLCLSGSDDPPIALRSGPEDTEARLCRGCEAGGIEYIFGLAGTAPLAAGSSARSPHGGALCRAPRGRASWVQAPPLHGLPGQSWNCQRRIVPVEAGPDGVDTRYIVTNLTDAGRSGSTSENTAREGEPAEELHLASVGPPAREPAPTNPSFCMAPPIGCSGPSRASCRSARPGASSTPCATG